MYAQVRHCFSHLRCSWTLFDCVTVSTYRKPSLHHEHEGTLLEKTNKKVGEITKVNQNLLSRKERGSQMPSGGQ